jgi:uncharacterized membrane protein
MPVVTTLATDSLARAALIQSAAGQLAVLLAVLAVIFWADNHPRIGRVFRVIPALVFCYFVPTTLTALGVIPAEAPLYEWVKQFVLPASLLLLTLALDLKGIYRLGPKAGIMLLAGTAGIILGGPLALWLWQSQVPDDAWRHVAYLAGSWIGGGANAVAMQKAAEFPDALVAPIVVVDVAVANLWMGVLLFLAGRHHKVDAWLKGDTTAITELQRRMADSQARVARPPTIADLIILLALGFGFAWLAHLAGEQLIVTPPFTHIQAYVDGFAWKVILVTTVGVGLSFTPARRLEGAGASKLGGVMIYVLVACIGAGADFHKLAEAHAFLWIGLTWIAVHVAVLLAVAKLIRAPFFFVAVGSQANVGGAASAPVVAAAFDPVLAPVGVLLAIAGYVLGTYGGLCCIWLCRLVTGGL